MKLKDLDLLASPPQFQHLQQQHSSSTREEGAHKVFFLRRGEAISLTRSACL